jgi:glucokinase
VGTQEGTGVASSIRRFPGQHHGPLIAADVGGTHARVGLVEGDAGRFTVVQYRKYACADFPGLADILADFRAGTGAADVAGVALAIAGYVVDDAVVNVNLPWPVSLSHLRRALGVGEFAVVNDFEAIAHAIDHVGADASLLSGPPSAAAGPVLVVGPGTGLGAALRIPRDAGAGGTRVLPTEAGQATLAADTDLEFELLRDLRRRGSRVLIEHVLSGTGLVNLDGALRRLRGAPVRDLTPAQVSAAAAAASDPIAVETVEVFCGWLGSVLGDFALLYGARGGIYLAGGVLPQMRGLLERSAFAARFLDKGPLREALARVPVRLVEHAQLGVIGAASWYFARDADAARTPAAAGAKGDA